MSMTEKLLFIWFLVVVVASFVFRHFWTITVYALSRAVALKPHFFGGPCEVGSSNFRRALLALIQFAGPAGALACL